MLNSATKESFSLVALRGRNTSTFLRFGSCHPPESGFYYLNSRYYDPNTCRFINADVTSNLGANSDFASVNLFAYCGNNPINRADITGKCWGIIIGAAIGAFTGLVGQIVSDVVTSITTGEVAVSNWQTYAGAVVGGAAGGIALAATGSVEFANATTGFVTTAVGQSLEKLTKEDYDKSWDEIAMNSFIDGVASCAFGKLPGVKKVTAGRNSFSAVYKSGMTKLRNKTVSTMSAKVIGKGVVSQFVGGLALDGYYGIKQAMSS